MSNGFRHFLGVLAGLILPPVLAGLLLFGVEGLPRIGATVRPEAAAGTIEVFTRFALVAGAAILFAFLAGSRISPIAALFGGLAFSTAGAMWMVLPQPTEAVIRGFPVGGMEASLQALIYHGVFLFIGVALLFSAFLPNRWRAKDPGRPAAYAGQEADYQAPRSDEAQVTFRTDGRSSGSEQAAANDVPGYRFLPKEAGGPPSMSRGFIDPTISQPDGVTQEFEQRKR
jgi:hypothetical protein